MFDDMGGTCTEAARSVQAIGDGADQHVYLGSLKGGQYEVDGED